MSAVDSNVADLIDAIGTARPQGPAIHIPHRGTLSFGALAAQLRYVRGLLQTWEFRPGDVVAGFSVLRPQMAVAIATLPSGCTFAPLAPTLSRELHVETLKRLRARAVIVDAGGGHALRAAADELGIGVLEIVADAAARPGLFELKRCRAAARAPAPSRTSAEHCYVISTSGTSGRRKLVPIRHRMSILVALATADRLTLGHDDIGVHLMPMHFGHGIHSALMSALLAGRSIVCLPEADIPALFDAIGEFGPTYLSAGFSIFQEIARRAADFPDALAHSRVRFMRSGSGHLALAAADRLEQAFSAPMLNGLSSTETGFIALDRFPSGQRKRGAAGLPLLNELAIFDPNGQAVPVGTQGEIVTRGPTLFEGYLDDPKLTAASFVGDWYCTGDLGSIDEDGYLHLHGRLREVINRGGEKISPVEIDVAIEELPGVWEAAVFGVPHASLGEEIVAAVVRAEGPEIEAAAITEHLRIRLGGERVPRHIHFVSDLPRTGNGKLRRADLAAAFAEDRAALDKRRGRGVRPGRAPMEIAVVALWAAILDVDDIGPDDDFFLLGGDSMSGGQLLGHVQAVLGVELSMRDLFGDSATVAGMARAVEVARRQAAPTAPGIGRGGPATASIQQRRDDGPAPLSPQHRTVTAPLSLPQQRLWFMARLEPDGSAYNVATAHELAGEIDVDALQRSLQAVIGRHEILRTTFEMTDAGPQQRIHPEASPDFLVVDLSSTPPAKRDGVLAETMAASIDLPFDLERGPLLRLRLFRLGGKRQVLLRVWHHLVTDRWSGAIFSRELSLGYGQALAGRPADLPPLRVQYADFARWQRLPVAQGAIDHQLGYWKARLEGLAPIDLPTDHPRPPLESHRGDRLTTEMSRDAVAGLEALARRERATLFMATLALFQVLLHRCTGAADIAVGTPVAGRRHSEVEDLIGFFLNTLVLRTDLSGEPTFAQMLARVRDGTLAAIENQDVPFERLVEAMAPARDPSRNPLFQVGFAFWNTEESGLDLEGLQARWFALPGRTSKFDLSLILWRTERGMDLTWEYCTDLFDRPTIARLATCFDVLAKGAIAQPRRSIGSLPLLSDAQRNRMLFEWNAHSADYPRQATVHSLFEAEAARNPGSIAVSQEGVEWTYGEIDRDATRLACRLAERGVRRGDSVAVCTGRSPSLVVALLGVLKAGAAYLPLDPEWPRERLAFMIEDAGAKIVVAESATAAVLPIAGPAPLMLDGGLPESASAAPGPATGVEAEDLAFVLYTSGSTGKPKGVDVPHRALVNLLFALRAHPGCTECDRVLALTTISFDMAAVEIFLPLSVGARVEIASRETAGDGRLLRRLIERWLPTIVQATPATWRMLIDAGWEGSQGLVAISGGERLSRELAQPLLARSAAVWNLYGPTETTVYSCGGKVEPGRAEITIGRPLANTEAYVLDARRQPVPIGVPGELYIAGDGVARGYRNRPQLTAERFLPHAFSSVAGKRMYRTGDRVKWTDGGRIAFLGRLDNQIKLRGFRIELDEIEASLREHPGVGACAVVLDAVNSEAARLLAYVVPSAGAAVDSASLRSWLVRWLPAYMLPSRFVVLERLPLTLSGKVDTRSLPPPQDETVIAGGPCADETIVAGIIELWRKSLRLQNIDPDDDFFLLGGHSLLAASVAAQLSAEFAIELPLRALFETSTAAGLAGKIAALKAGGAQPLPVIARRAK